MKICLQRLHQGEGYFSSMADTAVVGPPWRVPGPSPVFLYSLLLSTLLLLSLGLSPQEPSYPRPVKIKEGKRAKQHRRHLKIGEKSLLGVLSLPLP